MHIEETRQYALNLVRQGLSAKQSAAVVGVAHTTVADWAHAMNVPFHPRRIDRFSDPDPDSDWVDANGRLTMPARIYIQIRHRDGQSNARIAAALGVHRSTIGRELARLAHTKHGYRAATAHKDALIARQRPKPTKLATAGPLRTAVIELLNQRFSPQQVSHELAERFPERDDMHVSHEAIYQALYVQAKGSLREELKAHKALRTGRTSRRTSSLLPARQRRSWIGEARISARPAEAEDRAVPGHWEGDLVIGKGGQSALITLAERSTRFVLIHRLGGFA